MIISLLHWLWLAIFTLERPIISSINSLYDARVPMNPNRSLEPHPC